MTPKEMREYEEGKAYGYRYPHKALGWLKSTTWNHGLRAGQAEYWKDWKQRSARARAYRAYTRRAREAGREKQ